LPFTFEDLQAMEPLFEKFKNPDLEEMLVTPDPREDLQPYRYAWRQR